MRDALEIRNGGKGAVRLPKILVLTWLPNLARSVEPPVLEQTGGQPGVRHQPEARQQAQGPSSLEAFRDPLFAARTLKVHTPCWTFSALFSEQREFPYTFRAQNSRANGFFMLWIFFRS